MTRDLFLHGSVQNKKRLISGSNVSQMREASRRSKLTESQNHHETSMKNKKEKKGKKNLKDKKRLEKAERKAKRKAER